MNANSMMVLQSAHRDVLDAPIPDSDDSKRGLLEELKNRGRSAVGGKAWPDAKLLYEKSLSVAQALSLAQECAILHSNLSLVLSKMGRFDQAKVSALHATEQDRTYVKGWWRLGQALTSLNDYDGALEAMEKALLLDPKNKALTKECDKLRDEAAKAKEAAASAMPVDEQETSGPKTEPAPPRSEIFKAKPVAKKTKTTATDGDSKDVEMKDANSNNNRTSRNGDDDDEDDKNLFTKSEPVRGYKIVNGKKTSYFHNELSDEAKQLIGDIAPKKLDVAPADAANGDNSTNNVTSAWNQAGTWEERDVTAWAKEGLTTGLQNATFLFPESSPAPGALARVQTVKKVDGHASFAMVRGKKKYIYEFSIVVEWVLDLPNEADAVKGKLCFPDMDGTCPLGEGYDISNFEITSMDDPSLRPVVDRFIKDSGLRDALHDAMDGWVKQFRDKY